MLWTLSLLLRVLLPTLPVRGDDFKIQHFVRLKIIPELSSLAHEHNLARFDLINGNGLVLTVPLQSSILAL